MSEAITAQVSHHWSEPANRAFFCDMVVPPDITLLPLPPRWPELNPVEKLWQFMRDNWPSSCIYRSYGDIVDHCCHA